MDDFAAWIGRSEERSDVLDPSRSNVLQAALGGASDLKAGDALPACHHWLHFWEARTPAQTGGDGHPKRGGFLPPIALARRMWAGGRLIVRGPLHFGEPVRRVSTIRGIERKTGRNGELMFVTLRHEYYGPQGLAIEEEQDLVYRDMDRSGAAAAPAAPIEPAAPAQDKVDPDSVLLFRYSALTMNGHRIHYDHPYAVGEEGYRGLVVQGPLQATLLARLAGGELNAPLSTFHFRGLAPAIAGERLDLHAAPADSGLDLWVSQAGTRTMAAMATKAA
jgi:3-methylfumaryl-CoA hydratase